METPQSTRVTDAKIIALLAVMFACLVALVALLFHDASVSESRMQPLLSAHASVLNGTSGPGTRPVADPVPARPVTPEENWKADDASASLRPDAAH